MTAFMNIPFEDIVVGARMRQLREPTVTKLMESIREVGLLNPVSVTRGEGKKFNLVAGHHRLEAVKRLKIFARIQVIVIDAIKDADQATLAEIDENLCHAPLTPAEEALHVDRRKQLYEKLHPETRHGAIGRGREKSSQVENSFVEETAKKTGKGESTIARAAARGKKVKVLADIAGTALDKGTELDALAKLDESEQRELAERAKNGEEVSAKEPVEKATEPTDVRRDLLFEKALELVRPYVKQMTGDQRRRFIARIRRMRYRSRL
jgi:ParB-like chromosome segregation protein Spo0J